MAKYRPSGFIVVLPQTIMGIPQDGNLSWLTLFYALPKELVEKRSVYLNLPRNIKQLLASPAHRKLIEAMRFWNWSGIATLGLHGSSSRCSRTMVPTRTSPATGSTFTTLDGKTIPTDTKLSKNTVIAFV